MATTETKPKRTRKKAVEVPGAEEVQSNAPVTSAAINTATVELQQHEEFTDAEQPAVDFQATLAAEPHLQKHTGPQPKLGQRWAGMVLTANGWMNPDHVKE